MLPFDSWDVNCYSGTTEQCRLEAFFGPAASVFNSCQAGITAILEVLGSRTHDIPVVLPITAPTDTVSAVLRAGGNPILLDINPTTLQLEPSLLKEVIDTLKAVVVVFDRPCGAPVDQELLSLTQDFPTIIDTRLPPQLNSEEACVGTFTVFDFGPVVGTGSLVIHKYSDQVHELRLVRSGLLGLSANMNELICSLAHKRLKEHPDLAERKQHQNSIFAKYASLLAGKKEIVLADSKEKPYCAVRVQNANRAIAQLHGCRFTAIKPVFPLHTLPIMQRRWQETPEYPVAEDLANRLVALPTHPGVSGKEEEIVSKLLDVDGAGQ
jgi:dTDP-4-amino-4,6-dideoxygalactose transaminase